MKKLAEAETFTEVYGFNKKSYDRQIESIFAKGYDSSRGVIREALVKHNMAVELTEYNTAMACAGKYKDIEYDVLSVVDKAFDMGYESITEYIILMKMQVQNGDVIKKNAVNIEAFDKMLCAA
jgi:hypothetical protein